MWDEERIEQSASSNSQRR